MNSKEIRLKIKEILSKEFDINLNEITENSKLFSDGLLDSFNLIELVNELEEKFEIKFGTLDINFNNLDSIDNINSFIIEKLK